VTDLVGEDDATRLTEADRLHARSMCVAALAWTGYLGLTLHFYEHAQDGPFLFIALAGLIATWPLFWIEGVRAWRHGWANRKSLLWATLLPPLRLGVRDPRANAQIWFPRFGWRTLSPALQADVTHALSQPMLAVSILVLPVIVIEVWLHDWMATDARIRLANQFATALIWWAFTIEFVVMVSITEKRLDYVKKHWLDLAIILLPLLAFLRAVQLGRLLRLNNLTKTARMYKLRGVAMRTYRALLLVEAVRRLLQGTPERRLAHLRQRLIDHENEGRAIRAEIAELETRLAPPTISTEAA
jgi:hypothetical protein